jgi:aminotransferase
VLLPSPYFVNHEMAVTAAGAIPRELPLSEGEAFTVEWHHLEPQLSDRTRAVVICTPSNPTGAVVAKETLARIARELAARQIVLFVDEAYTRFVYDGEATSLAAIDDWRDNGVVIGSFSKAFGITGWRVGYLLASAAVCETAIRIQDAMVICAPVPFQLAIEAALRESWDYPDAFKADLVARRKLLAREVAGIPKLRWTRTPGGFFAFVAVEGCRDSAALAEEILERTYVVTVPGSTFGRAGEGFLRLSYSAVSAEELSEAMHRLRAFFS